MPNPQPVTNTSVSAIAAITQSETVRMINTGMSVGVSGFQVSTASIQPPS